ncbi:uncharacterized protein LOC120634307 [Pararge aegeria]|uniref:Jg4862 protein n=1 Tax=Pararge aegeria aegeria TaxID=348720 RepID=A0A8S4S3F2_9NEOP|nr:uncharacterized protein LOC120634307 [Pararge aegeria]CAH2245716.1 jg4862 [Pararge aegeria aegeria]
MSKLTVTNFSNRTGSPYKIKDKEEQEGRVHEEVLQKNTYDIQKEKNNELLQKVNKKTAEYQSNKPSSGVFTEVVTHGAFTSKKFEKEKSPKTEAPVTKANSSKTLLGFPSSANDLALDAKTDLESDPNISKEVKEKIIEKLFTLVSMVQHAYEAKVRIMTEFDKFKDTHMKNELRREREHSEQLYKLNMNFQNEVIQSVQQLRSELDLTRNFSNNTDESGIVSLKDISLNYDSVETTNTSNSQDIKCDAINGD